MQKDTHLQTIKADNFVKAFKTNNETVLKVIYKENYRRVELYIIQNNGTKHQAKDIYQEAFLAVWKNIKNNRFFPKNKNSINKYLYTIAKNKWIDYLRSNDYKKTTTYSKLNGLDIGQLKFEITENYTENNDKLNKVMLSFQNLGYACKTLLTKFYFEKKSMKEIALELQLDVASVRNKKYRCMQKLRKLVLNNDNEK